MQSNITFKRSRRVLKTLTVLTLLCFSFGMAIAQPYVNGNLSTGATATGGTAAPAGYTWSEVQAGNGSGGFAASITATGFKVADDFTVPAGQTWNLSSMVFYGYQTGYASTTVSPFTTVRVTIHSGSVTGPVVFGDQTTNRFASSANANMYRIFNATPDQTRRVWSITATTVASLAAGTYWVEYATDVTGGAGHFLPASTVVGTVTQTGNNAQQWTGAAWVPLVDGTNVQDMPFTVNYTATGAACTAVSPGNTISSVTAACPSVPFNLSVQTPGTGIGLSYQWQSSPNNTTYTDIAGATSPTYTTTQTVATWYKLKVTCGANAPLFSNAVNVTMSTSCYCIPATADCTDGDLITNVTLGTLNNNSTCGPAGYTNYTTNPAITVPDVIQGAANSISVTVGDGGTEFVGVWIDYDHSGSFEASEFSLIGSGNNVTVTGNINVPASALLGVTRMRVRDRYLTAITGTQACTTGGVYGEVEDYNVNIVPCVPVAITGAPTSATITCGGNAAFTVTATGSFPAYQWEFRTSPTAAWQLITAATSPVYSGINTKTLQLTSAPVSFNGYQYRAIVSGACTGPDFSAAATLTVNPFTLAVTPSSGNVCSTGGTPVLLTVPNNTNVATFTNNTSGVIPDGDTNPANVTLAGITRTFTVSGITGSVLNMRLIMNATHAFASDIIYVLKAPNGSVLNLSYAMGATSPAGANLVGTTITSVAGANALSSGTAPWTGTFRPDAQLVDIGAPTGPTGYFATVATFPALYSTPNGTWTLAMYDYAAEDQGTFNSATLEITYGAPPASAVFTPATGLYTNAAATTPYVAGTPVAQVYALPAATTTYTATVSTATCTAAAQQIVVSVNTPVTGTPAVANQVTCAGTNATFSVTGITGGTGATYQWQVSTGGAAFTDIAGATSATYTVSAPTTAQGGNQYRVKITSAGCAATTTLTSTAGTLTVNATPVVVISAAPSTNVIPGSTVTLTAATSPNAATSYQWFNNGVAVAGATSNTLVVGIDGIGSYTVKVTDVNGCSNTANASTPASINVTTTQSNNLFIYPSPNTGKFQVRYYNDLNDGQNGPAILNVYDSKGARVFTNRYVLGAGYQAMQVDLASHGKGVYRVDLLNTNGERLKTGNVLVY